MGTSAIIFIAAYVVCRICDLLTVLIIAKYNLNVSKIEAINGKKYPPKGFLSKVFSLISKFFEVLAQEQVSED